MKSRPVNILLLVSVCCAVYFFTLKFRTPTEPDKIMAGLKGLDKYLPTGAHIVFKCAVPGADEYPAYVSYCLAPVKLVPPSSNKNDTTLMILPLQQADSATVAILKNASVIWENKDDRYQYILIHS